MATQRFDDAHFLAAASSLAQLQMASYATFASTQAIGGRDGGAEAIWPTEAVSNPPSVAKGVGWAIAIEGGTALCLYAVWSFWHLWR
jgi:hypothetical protein